MYERMAVIAIFVVFTSPMLAQDVTLRGTVTDTTGAVLSDARVTVENLATHHRSKLRTDAHGNFTISLQPGQYRIICKAKNFETYSKVLTLEKATVEVHIALRIGKITLSTLHPEWAKSRA